MSAVLEPKNTAPRGDSSPNARADFAKKLQVISDRALTATTLDDFMADLSKDACELFEADRLTLYTLTDDKSSLISRVKTGLSSFKDLKLPITETSIAGYCAYHKAEITLSDTR